MGEPRRMQSADAIYLITNRTIGGQPLMKPSRAVNQIIENDLAWAAYTRGIKLFCHSFEPDRFFIICSAPLLNRGNFMCAFQGLMAKQVNAEIGRSGKFFAGRYRCSHLLDDEAVVEALEMVLGRARKIRTDAGAQPVSSWELHRTGEALTGEREDRAKYREIRRANPGLSDADARRRATTTYSVELAKLPCWGASTHMAYHKQVCERVRSASAANATGSFDIDASKDLARARRIRELQRARPPRCMAAQQPLARRFRRQVRDKNDRYERAAVILRRGLGQPEFPHGMIPPHQSRAVGADGRLHACGTSPDSGAWSARSDGRGAA